MSPTIPAGSTAQYQRGAGGIVRGDVALIQSPSGQQVSRVIGLPGDRVMCCNSDGWMEVDGQPLIEYYLAFNASPSQTPFTVTLGAGQMWLMGDNRAATLDSRTWGPLPMTDIVGRVYGVSGPNGRYLLKTPETFIADGLAPADHRVPLPLVLALAGRRRPGGGDRAGNGRHHQVGDPPPPAQTSPAAAVTVGQPPGVMRPDS